MKTMLAAQRLGLGSKLADRMKGIFSPHIMTRQEVSQRLRSGSVPRGISQHEVPIDLVVQQGHQHIPFRTKPAHERMNPVEALRRARDEAVLFIYALLQHAVAQIALQVSVPELFVMPSKIVAQQPRIPWV